MKNVKVAKSTRSGKKYQAKFEDGHTVHFGAAGMSDFTKNKDPERRKAYLARHRKLGRQGISRILVTLLTLGKNVFEESCKGVAF